MAGVAAGLTQEEARLLISEHRFLKSCAAGYRHRPHEHGRRWTVRENIRDCKARVNLAAQDERHYTLLDWRNIATRSHRRPPPPVEEIAAPDGLNHREKNLLRSITHKQKDYAMARQRYLNMREAGAHELKQHADRVVRAYREAHGMDNHTWEHPEYREPMDGAAGAEAEPAHDAIEHEVDDPGGEDAGAPPEDEDAGLAADRNALRLAILGMEGGVIDPDWDVSLWSQPDVRAGKSALDRREAILAAGDETLPDGTALPKRNTRGSISPGCRGKPGRTVENCVFPCAWKRGREDDTIMCRSARTTRPGFRVGKTAADPIAAADVD